MFDNVDTYVIRNTIMNKNSVDNQILKDYLNNNETQKYEYLFNIISLATVPDINENFQEKNDYGLFLYKQFLHFSGQLDNYTEKEIELMGIYYVFISTDYDKIENKEGLINLGANIIDVESEKSIIIWMKQYIAQFLLIFYGEIEQYYINGFINKLIDIIGDYKNYDNNYIYRLKE